MSEMESEKKEKKGRSGDDAGGDNEYTDEESIENCGNSQDKVYTDEKVLDFITGQDDIIMPPDEVMEFAEALIKLKAKVKSRKRERSTSNG